RSLHMCLASQTCEAVRARATPFTALSPVAHTLRLGERASCGHRERPYACVSVPTVHRRADCGHGEEPYACLSVPSVGTVVASHSSVSYAIGSGSGVECRACAPPEQPNTS